MNQYWGLKLAVSKQADMMTPEGRETLGQVAGGAAGMAGGTALLEGIGQVAKPLSHHGGYGATMMKLLSGAEIKGMHGRGWPVRLALATLMGMPYGLSMTLGQRLGGEAARSLDKPAVAKV